MKNKLQKWIFIFVFALSVAGLSDAALAYCQWVPAHWRHGVLQPAHRVCNGGGWNRGYGNRCKWVPAHWRHGVKYPAQRVCWR